MPVDPPLRIAMLAPPWYEVPPRGYGGIEAVCATLTEALLARGHDVTLIGAGRTGTSARFVRTYDAPQGDRLGQAVPELAHVARADRQLATGNYDLVHDHTFSGPLTAQRRRIPTIATVHNDVGGEFGDVYGSISSQVPLVAISAAQRDRRPGLPWCGVVHNGLRPDAFPFQREKAEYALWLARFCPEKGADRAITACRQAGVPLVLAGKCSEPAEKLYLDEVVKPALGPDVELIVDAARPLVLELLASARCLLLPLRWSEPFGMVLIEAMACGTPVVALRRGAVPEVVAPGRTGLICDHPDELPAALHAVTAIDPARCRAHVERSFSAEAMAARYERLYRTVVPANRAAVMVAEPTTVSPV